MIARTQENDFKKTCPCCGRKFIAKRRDQVYFNKSHAHYAYEQRRKEKEAQAIRAAQVRAAQSAKIAEATTPQVTQRLPTPIVAPIVSPAVVASLNTFKAPKCQCADPSYWKLQKKSKLLGTYEVLVKCGVCGHSGKMPDEIAPGLCPRCSSLNYYLSSNGDIVCKTCNITYKWGSYPPKKSK